MHLLVPIQVAFVFDIEDLRKKYSDALNNLLCYLPIELVKDIATKMGATTPFLCSSGDIYKTSDFHLILYQNTVVLCVI